MLSELQITRAKPKEKTYVLRDEKGLYLKVDTAGRKYFILRYWEDGRERQFSLGVYPEISLRDARLKRDELQLARAKGEKISKRSEKTPETFHDVAEQWLKVRMKDKAAGYLKAINLRLKKYILPAFGNMKLAEIKSPDVLRLCRKIEDKGFFESACRVRALIGQVFRFSIASGYCEHDPTQALTGALAPSRHKHMAAMFEPSKIKILMVSIKNYPFDLMRCALLFSIYTAARPGEIRTAEWSEIKGDTWDIPAEKMKMKRRHIVPLSKQVLKVIEELRPLTCNSKYLFPSPRSVLRCMSENGVRVALRSLGFTKEQITPHGFRAMFSTIANEHEFNRDVIERQLAHVPDNAIRGAYNHAEYLAQRKKLMQWWADWLDGLTDKSAN